MDADVHDAVRLVRNDPQNIQPREFLTGVGLFVSAQLRASRPRPSRALRSTERALSQPLLSTWVVQAERIPVRSVVRPQSALVCLESPHRGGVRPSRLKRGRDSASLYGLRLVRFTGISSKRTRRRAIWKAGNHRPHRTLSNSRFGRHETGSAIQRLMSDSCQPVPLVLILS